MLEALSSQQQQNAPPEDPNASSVVVVVDMVGYSTLARLLEENAGPAAVAQLNRQIQDLLEVGLGALPPGAALTRIADTGDGAILLFDLAEHAHLFAKQVLTRAGEHNESRSDATAKRWFRIGIASGQVTRKNLDQQEGGYAGIAIANAVRLESAAHRGEIVADLATFEALPAPMRRLYGPESTIRGKRTEIFRVRKYRVMEIGDTPRRTLINPKPWAIATFAVLLAAVAAYLFLHRSRPLPFQAFQIKQITDTGNYIAAAVSPDSRYLLSAVSDNGRQSLWLRNLPTNSNTRIIAPAVTSYDSLAFSSDGNYIYFRQRVSTSNDTFALYRAPVLGGAPQLIVRDAESGASFSPDGKRIAFVRSAGPTTGKFLLATSDLDGTGEHVITSGPESFFPSFVAWSPDNRQIALAAPLHGQGDLMIQLFSPTSSSVKTLARFDDLPIDSITWAPNGSGLLVTYENTIGYETRNQIGFISSPAGQFRTVTSDTNHYGEVSVSSDGSTLTTVQRKVTHTLYEMPPEGFAGEPPAPALAQSRQSAMFGWGADNSIYFGTTGNLLRVSADGADRDTLLSDPHTNFNRPSVCAGGRYIVLNLSNNAGAKTTNPWRVGIDGSNPKQLTFGPVDVSPVCTPDGKWVYYNTVTPMTIRRVPLEGGPSEAVPGASDANTTRIKLSADGRFLIFFKSATDTAGKLVIVPLDTGPRPQVRMLQADPRCIGQGSFSPDGTQIISVIREGRTDNLWSQPIDGSSAGRQITHFAGDTIEFFEFSPDGKTLGVLRTHSESDVVLLQDTATHRN